MLRDQRQDAGSYFDPDVAEAFFATIDEIEAIEAEFSDLVLGPQMSPVRQPLPPLSANSRNCPEQETGPVVSIEWQAVFRLVQLSMMFSSISESPPASR